MKPNRTPPATIHQRSSRRSFLQRTALAGGSLLCLSAGSAARAAAGEADSAGNETLKTIHALRTIHGNFLDQPIPDALIQTVLQASVRAANASNMQSYSIVVVKDRQTMKDLCGYRGSCLLLYCVDYSRLVGTAALMGYSYFPDNLTAFVTASVNAGLAVQTAAIAARSLGLDSLITNGIHRGDMERVWKILNLPAQYCFPLIAMVLGYPREEPAHPKGRLDGAGVIHHGTYQPLSESDAAGLIQQYDDPARHLALEEDWKAKGHKHYLDWFFRDWAGNSQPTAKETQMLRLLRRSGFVERPQP